MSTWVKQHKLFLALFGLILVTVVLAVVMWSRTRPPVTSLWQSFDAETRTLTFEAGLGYTIDSFTATDAGTGDTVTLTAPPSSTGSTAPARWSSTCSTGTGGGRSTPPRARPASAPSRTTAGTP